MKDCTRNDVYRIRVKGHLDDSWAEWFDGLAVTHEDDETTMLTGAVTDQAALHGLIAKVRNLSLQLLLVERIEKV